MIWPSDIEIGAQPVSFFFTTAEQELHPYALVDVKIILNVHQKSKGEEKERKKLILGTPQRHLTAAVYTEWSRVVPAERGSLDVYMPCIGLALN